MLNKNFGTYNWLFWPQMPRSHFLKRKIILINIVVHATYVINDELMTKLLRERKPSRNKDVIFSATARAHNQIKSMEAYPYWRNQPIVWSNPLLSHTSNHTNETHDPPLMFLYSPPYSSIHSYSMPHKNGPIYPVGSGTQMAITNPLRHSCLDLGPPTQYNMNRSVPKKPWKEPS